MVKDILEKQLDTDREKKFMSDIDAKQLVSELKKNVKVLKNKEMPLTKDHTEAKTVLQEIEKIGEKVKDYYVKTQSPYSSLFGRFVELTKEFMYLSLRHYTLLNAPDRQSIYLDIFPQRYRSLSSHQIVEELNKLEKEKSVIVNEVSKRILSDKDKKELPKETVKYLHSTDKTQFGMVTDASSLNGIAFPCQFFSILAASVIPILASYLVHAQISEIIPDSVTGKNKPDHQIAKEVFTEMKKTNDVYSYRYDAERFSRDLLGLEKESHFDYDNPFLGSEDVGLEKKLTSAERRALPDSVFGLPEKREYPMPDRGHAIAAKARAKEMLEKGYLSKKDYKKIIRKADEILGEE